MPAGVSDEARAAYTVRHELIGRLRAGEGAEWLHEVGLGVPGARLVSWGLWSPFHLPAFALPFDLAWTLGVLLRLLAAATGAWLLARHCGGRRAIRAAASVAAVLLVLALGLVSPRADVLAAAPALWWAVGTVMRRSARWWHGLPLVAAASAVWLGGSVTAALLVGVVGAGVVAAHLWRRRREGARRLLRPVAAVLVGVGLAVGLAGFTLLPSLELLRDADTRAVVRAAQRLDTVPLRPPGVRLVSTEVLRPRPRRLDRLASASVRGRIGTARGTVPPHSGLAWGVALLTPEDLAGPRARPLRDRLWPDGPRDPAAFPDATQARSLLGALGVSAVLRAEDTTVVDVRPSLPTVHVTAGAVPMSSGAAVHAVARAGVGALARAALVEAYEDQPLTDLPDGDGDARLASVGRAGGHVRARVQSARGAVLVSLDRALPGWQARIDGRRDTTLRADALFVGVPVPPGTHLVELRYEPPAAVAGVVTSLRALGGLGGWLLLRWLRERTGMSTRELLLAAAHEGRRRWIHRGR